MPGNMPCPLVPGRMVSDKLSVVLLDDLIGWESSIHNFAKTTRATCFDMRTIPLKELRSEISNITRTFDSLIGSEITQIYLGKETSKPLTRLNRDSESLVLQVGEWQRLVKVLPETKVEKLSIVNCKLETENILSLLAVLRRTRVTNLDLSDTCIRLKNSQVNEFVGHIRDSRLESLHLSGDGMASFQEVTDFFRSLFLTCIQRLVLSDFFRGGLQLRDCNDHELHLRTMVSGLKYSNLTELALDGNWHHWTPKLGDPLAEALGAVLPNTKLEKLSLRETGISDRGVDFLVRGLVDSKITFVNLGYNRINGENLIGDSLKHTKIKELDLKGNGIKSDRMFSGANILQGSSVNVLNLRFCYYWSNALLVPLLGGLKFSELTSLDLSSNRLGLAQYKALADMLVHSKLSHLNLSENYLWTESFSILGESFKKSKLKHIGLDRTLGSTSHDTVRGVDSFLDNIKDTTIITLTLRNNSPNGSFEIFAPILENGGILALDLSYNRCSNVIVNRAWQLKLLTSITALNLAYNDIGDEEVAILAQYLPGTQIVMLRLSFNNITCQGATALASILEKTKLRYLDLRENEIEAAGAENLAENLRSTCVTYLNVSPKPHRTISPPMRRNLLLIDTRLWENRRRIQRFAELLKKAEVFTTNRNIVEFRRSLDTNAVNDFILNCLKLHKMVSKEPSIVTAIEQDKCILDLIKRECLKYSHDRNTSEYNVYTFIEDCDLLHTNITEHPSCVQDLTQPIVQRHFLRFVLQKLRNFLNLTGEDADTDVGQLISQSEEIYSHIPEVFELLQTYHTF